MASRKERKARYEWRLRCLGCGGWRVGPHFDPFTKTYICQKSFAPTDQPHDFGPPWPDGHNPDEGDHG